MKVILIIYYLFFNLFQEDIKNIQGIEWILVKYTHPFSFKEEIIEANRYLHGCTFKYVIKFETKGKFITIVNDKWEFKGTYKPLGSDAIKIYSKIILKVYDTDQQCHVDTYSRAIVKEMLASVTNYQVSGDSLRLRYKVKDHEGFMDFISLK